MHKLLVVVSCDFTAIISDQRDPTTKATVCGEQLLFCAEACEFAGCLRFSQQLLGPQYYMVFTVWIN